MDLRWLQDFLTVAETGNFTRAAETRGVSQAAFSRRIQALEAWLGTALIDRGEFPTRLTPEGEHFRDQASEIVRRVIDSRMEFSHTPVAREAIRIALPHALATGRLPAWWQDWTHTRALTCKVLAGNVHDTVTAFVSGMADLLICFHHPEQPIQLAADQYERVLIGEEQLRPYVATQHGAELRAAFPGSAKRPLALLMYSPGAYLARMVDLIFQRAPESVHGPRVIESDMADVLREMAQQGYGTAWLPDCTAAPGVAAGGLVAVGGPAWSLPLSVMAYRDKKRERSAADELWSRLILGAAPVPTKRGLAKHRSAQIHHGRRKTGG